MTIPTHTNPGARTASYDGRGPLMGAPTALTGSVRVVADDQRVAGLPVQRRLVPELRRESPGTLPTGRPLARSRALTGTQTGSTDVAYTGSTNPTSRAAGAGCARSA